MGSKITLLYFTAHYSFRQGIGKNVSANKCLPCVRGGGFCKAKLGGVVTILLYTMNTVKLLRSEVIADSEVHYCE